MKYRLLALVACASIFVAPAHAVDRTTPINITNSVTATVGSFSAALGAVAQTTNYICGFVITSGGSSAASVVTATATGTISGTLNFSYVFPSSGQGILGVAFPQCIAATGQDTAITVSVPAGGTGTSASLSVWGYQL